METADAELRNLRASLEALACDGVPPALTPGGYFTVHNNLHHQLKLYLLGVIATELSDDAAALSYAAQLDELAGRPSAMELARDQAIGIRARVEKNRGRPAEALELLESAHMSALFELTIASPFFAQSLDRFLRADLLQTVGRTDEAIRWYSSFGEHSIFDLIYLPTSHLRRAEILEERGDRQAAAHYQRFVDFWSDCDQEFHLLLEPARVQLASFVT